MVGVSGPQDIVTCRGVNPLLDSCIATSPTQEVEAALSLPGLRAE